MKKNNHGFAPIIILTLIVLIAGGAYYFGTLKNKNTSTTVTSVQPSSSPIINPSADPTTNWKTYTNRTLGITLKYPNFYIPIGIYTPLKSGEPIFIVTGLLNFDSNKIALCKTYTENLCLIPGKNWFQEKDIQPTTLADKKAISFFVSTKNANSGSAVIHVIQTTEKPLVELALTVDGQGGEETFQQITSTFQFTK